jgi:hypothetical protein
MVYVFSNQWEKALDPSGSKLLQSFTGPPMLVVKGARRDERWDNIAIAQGRFWINWSLFQAATGSFGVRGLGKKGHKAAPKAAKNGDVLTGTHSYGIKLRTHSLRAIARTLFSVEMARKLGQYANKSQALMPHS